MDDLEKLYDNCFELLCKYSYNIVHRTDVAEDIVQECFIIFQNNKNTIKNKKLYENWLKKTVRNKSIDYFRKHLQKNFTISIDSLTKNYNTNNIKSLRKEGLNIIELYDNDSNILERIINADSKKILNDAVDKLTPKYKKIYKMYEFKGIKHKVIAEELGITVGTSKSNLNKARKKLKKILSEDETIT